MLISLSDFDTLFWRTAEGGSALQSDRSSTPLNAYTNSLTSRKNNEIER